jgi:hypothetical protein
MNVEIGIVAAQFPFLGIFVSNSVLVLFSVVFAYNSYPIVFFREKTSDTYFNHIPSFSLFTTKIFLQYINAARYK